MENNQPLVSVTVITFNSSKTVVETLDSIYNQTYPKLELIVSDDCSTDNTVQVCRDWIEGHKERFARTELLTVEKNTGISANLNRAESECQGDWVKGVAGDDLLLPDCISDFLGFVADHPDAKCVFGKVKCFGGTQELRELYESQRFKYDFFALPADQQLRRLLLEGYTVPALGYFFNRLYIKQLGVVNDERIPFWEDCPKWINLLKRNVRFYFLNKEVAEYRLGSGISSQNEVSVEGYRNAQLFNVYYKFPELVALGEDEAINREVEELTNIFRQKIMAEQVRFSHSYRLGRKILQPIKWISSLFNK